MLKAFRNFIVENKTPVNDIEEIICGNLGSSIRSESHYLAGFKDISKNLRRHRCVHAAEASE